ncbi:hypothetical protein PAMP_006535 [Pampus punctatissimus]
MITGAFQKQNMLFNSDRSIQEGIDPASSQRGEEKKKKKKKSHFHDALRVKTGAAGVWEKSLPPKRAFPSPLFVRYPDDASSPRRHLHSLTLKCLPLKKVFTPFSC